jgi:hypothetical protein
MREKNLPFRRNDEQQNHLSSGEYRHIMLTSIALAFHSGKGAKEETQHGREILYYNTDLLPL